MRQLKRKKTTHHIHNETVTIGNLFFLLHILWQVEKKKKKTRTIRQMQAKIADEIGSASVEYFKELFSRCSREY